MSASLFDLPASRAILSDDGKITVNVLIAT